MTAISTSNSSPSSHTICLPFQEESYNQIVADPVLFRAAVDRLFAHFPELFPSGFHLGYRFKDRRISSKLNLPLRRIALSDRRSYSIRPSFVMPYCSAHVPAVEHALFLRKFAVPYWALARVFGRHPSFWHRLECALGDFRLVGTTVRRGEIPEHLLADEHHQTRDGQKVYVAATVGAGCCLGAEVVDQADAEELTAAYGVFRDEAREVSPKYSPKTVNVDGWKATTIAWKRLFFRVAIILCFLHGWLKIRDRSKHLGETFLELGQRVWQAYRAETASEMKRRLVELKKWAKANLEKTTALEAVLRLCGKGGWYAKAYRYRGCHRTSNMLDRVMRGMNRYLDSGQHFHGSKKANGRRMRGWALLYNFSPWHPAEAKANGGWRSPAERLNQHRYHDNWLENLLISASLAGYRIQHPQK